MLVYEQDFKSEKNGGVRDTRLDKIGNEVETEYGDGTIVAVEIFKEYWASERYLVEIFEPYGKEILKGLFPDNRLAFWERELTFKK